jgi:hypothetical protein
MLTFDLKHSSNFLKGNKQVHLLVFSKYLKEHAKRIGRFALFAEIQSNHREKFGDEYFLVTFDEDKNASFEPQYMESIFVDEDHHIAHNKNAGTKTVHQDKVDEQWRKLLRKVEKDSNRKVVVKEVCLMKLIFF